MKPNYHTHSGESWAYYSTVNGTTKSFSIPARRIRIGGAGDLYLIPLDSNAEVLFAADVLQGEQFDIQFSGIGPSSTVSKVTVEF